MARLVLTIATVSLLACAAEGPQLPAAGEVCDAEGQCAAGLDCQHLICVDDRGPQVTVVLPEPLTVFGSDLSSLVAAVSAVDASDGDQIELIVDPGDADPHRELLALVGGSASLELMLPAPLAPGPHHVRARLVDGDGQPYPNPSASAEAVVFVRPPDDFDRPQVAVVWPPSGYQHRVGNPLEVEVVVLPGSFTFTRDSDEQCEPLDDCEPEFAPECEGPCGPVSREGFARMYLEPDYPGCLLDTPINCNGNYVASLRPGTSGVEVLHDYRVRGMIWANPFTEPGMIPLHVGLSYPYHDSYPSNATVIHETITIEVID